MNSNTDKRKYFALADIFVAAVILFTAAAGFFALIYPSQAFSYDTDNTAVIRVNGEIYSTIDLDNVKREYEITVHGRLDAVIRVSPDGICFADSGCRDRLCVHSGMLSRPGQSAVCLPARISVTVESGSAAGHQPDAVSE